METEFLEKTRFLFHSKNYCSEGRPLRLNVEASLRPATQQIDNWITNKEIEKGEDNVLQTGTIAKT